MEALAVYAPTAEGATGSREYHFFRGAIKWLEENGKLPKGTSAKYLREAMTAAQNKNGMMDWQNVFDDLQRYESPQNLYRLALEKVRNHMRDFAYSDDEGERKVYQRLAKSARRIAERREEDTGHGTIKRHWEDAAQKLEKEAEEGANCYGETIEPAEIPEAAEADFGFGEIAGAGAEVAEGIGAEVAEGIGAGMVEEVLSIFAAIFLI